MLRNNLLYLIGFLFVFSCAPENKAPETCNTIEHNEEFENSEIQIDTISQDSTIRIGLQVHFVTFEGSGYDTAWIYKVDSILEATNEAFLGYIAFERYEYIWEYKQDEPIYLNDIRNDASLEDWLTGSKFEEGYLNWFILPAIDNLGGYAPVPSDTTLYGEYNSYDCVFTSDSYFKRKYVYSLIHEAAHNLGRLKHLHDPPKYRLGIDLNYLDYGAIKDHFLKWQLFEIIDKTKRHRGNLIL